MARGHFNPDINPHLLKLIEGFKYDKYNVNPISGYRPGDLRQHGRGQAIDIQLTDPKTGAALSNYHSPETFGAYQQYANALYQYALQNDPELAKQLRWGGYFSGGKDKYGSLDLMHFDTAGQTIGTAGGNWEQGLSPEQAKIWGLQAGGGLGAQQQAVAADMQQKGYSQTEILNALAAIESRGSGDYTAVGAEADPAGHRARGRYQVMDYNVAPWAEQYLGMKGVTPEQFQNDPALQDKLAGAVMMDYIDKYGVRGAYSKWFTGSEKEPGTSDVHGRLTGKTYADMSMEQLMRGNNKASDTVDAPVAYNSPSEGGARFGGTGLGTPDAKVADKKDKWNWKDFGKKAAENFADMAGGGVSAPASTIGETPKAVLAPGQPTTYSGGSDQETEMRRQNLAMLMQKLNAGRLF